MKDEKCEEQPPSNFPLLLALFILFLYGIVKTFELSTQLTVTWMIIVFLALVLARCHKARLI